MKYIPCTSAEGMMPLIPLKEVIIPFTLACGVATKVYSAVGSTLFMRIITKRELIASSVPLRIVEKLDNVLLLSLFTRLTLHPKIAGVLHASSHVNSNVLLLTLLQVT